MSDNHSHDEHPDHIELPAPTAWPIIFAFGLTLSLAGLVTSIVVSGVGLVCVAIAILGLFKDVFPSPQHVFVPLVPLNRRPAPIKTTGRSVKNLHVGEDGHREHLPVTFHSYSSGIYGGMAGGIVMAIMAMGYGLFAEGSIWYPINLLAASALPSMALDDVEKLKQFAAFPFIIAVITHVVFSVLVGLLYAVLLPMLPRRYEWFWGGIVIPVLWTVCIYLSLGTVNPMLSLYIDWPWFTFCQVAFGFVTGIVVFKSGRMETMQSWSLHQKLGVHAPGPKKRSESNDQEGS